MFVAAQFSIVKIWKEFGYPSTDEWEKKLSYVYTMEYYSGIKICIWVSSDEVDGLPLWFSW